jgi:dTDP-D-glucose 4,6-dehydratase
MRERLTREDSRFAQAVPQYDDFRPGDIRFSCASIEKARRMLSFEPTHDVAQGLAEALDWYLDRERGSRERDTAVTRRQPVVASTINVPHYPSPSLTPAAT